MSWKKQRSLQGKNRYYSLSKKLRRENKSNDEFEVMISQLTLEELIGLKLELASKVLLLGHDSCVLALRFVLKYLSDGLDLG